MKATLLGLVLLAGTGCMNVQPIGPLAKMAGGPKGAPHGDARDAAAPEPVSVPAARPVPPALLITPGEVVPETAAAATQKLMNEFEYDRKNTPEPPKTAEVSHIKGGVKQN